MRRGVQVDIVEVGNISDEGRALDEGETRQASMSVTMACSEQMRALRQWQEDSLRGARGHKIPPDAE